MRIFYVILVFLLGCSTVDKNINSSGVHTSCIKSEKIQKERSLELSKIVEEDQKDRQPPIDWSVVSPRDERRAKRVAEIFAEGCIKTAKDYAAAALVFQHGTVPDHYYQAYLWAKKAYDLGDKNQAMMIGNAVDRYLINRGYKQIFAAQTFRYPPKRCVCLAQTELKFSDKLRKMYMGKSLKEKIAEVKARNSKITSCEQSPIYCDKNLVAPPRNLFPGFW